VTGESDGDPGSGGSAPFWRRAELGFLGRRSRQVLLLAALTGLLTAGVVAGFEYLVNEQMLSWVESWPLALQAGAPAVGLVGAALALRYLAGGASPEMSEEYIHNFHDRHHRLDRGPVPGRVVASAATLGLGGTMGFEGPSIYIGAAIGAAIQARLTRYFSREDAKTLMVAGAAAGLAAVFKAPATGAVFALEVPYQDDLAGRMVLPALCASAVSYTTFVALRSTAPLLPIGGSSAFHLVDLGGAIVVGLACGVGARVFSWALRSTKRIARSGSIAARVTSAGVLLAALAIVSHLVTGTALTLGPGYRAVGWALDQHHGLAAVGALLMLRAVAVLVVVGGGGAGGLFIPLVVEGALLGRILGGLLGMPASPLYPVLGIAAFLAGGYRTPLTAVMFVAETTGRPGFVVPALLAAVVSQLVMGSHSIAPDQVAARAGHLEKRLRLPVSAAVATDATTVPSALSVADFVRSYAVGRHTLVAPVVNDGRLVGVIDLSGVEAVPRNRRKRTLVGDAMRGDHPVGRIAWTLREAVSIMEANDVDVLPIVDASDHYVGLLTTAAILALGDILDESDDYGPSPSGDV